MEQPLYRNELDPNNPLSGDAGSFSPEKSKLAGHIVLHESPHGGEISLNSNKAEAQTPARPMHLPKAAVGEVADIPAQPSRPVELSAWHNTNLSAEDYGQAFHRERAKEQVADPMADTAQPAAPQTPVASTQSQVVPQQAASGPMLDANAHYTPPASTTMPSNPLYGVMPQNQPLGNAADVAQPLPENTYQQAVTMNGAVNPSVPTTTPQEPRLPAGKPTHVDPQHLLPTHRSAIKRIAQNPVVWLAIGIAMIIYFGSSLF